MNTASNAAQQHDDFVIDATQDNFASAVIEKSRSTPVLVDLWAEWCGPCTALGPVLEKLAAEYRGAFILAKVDVDREQALAAAFGARSIPMVVLLKDGQPVDAFTGALPEGEVRRFLDQHIDKPALIEGVDDGAGEAATEVEPPAHAVARIRAEMAANPEDEARVFDLVQALLRNNELDAVRAELAKLPVNLETDARARRLHDQLDLADALGQAPDEASLRARLDANPDDHEARDLLGVRLLMQGDAEAGLAQFMELLRRDRDWRDGQARKRLVAAFQMLDDAALVGRYRRQMSSLLF